MCSSIFPKGWVAGMDYKFMGFFTLRNQDGTLSWVSYNVAAYPRKTIFYAVIRIGGGYYRITNTINASERLPIYHNSWIRACITLDTAAGAVKIVVDGKVLEDALHPKLRNLEIPRHSIIRVGRRTGIHAMFSDLNVFSELLSIEKMVAITTPGRRECGSRGDLFNWDKAKWILSDKWATGEWADWVLVVNASKLVELDWISGPCWRPSKIKFYPIENQNDQSDCMKHCQKIGYGRSPSVLTEKDFRWLEQELEESLPHSFVAGVWLPATEGDSGETLIINHCC